MSKPPPKRGKPAPPEPPPAAPPAVPAQTVVAVPTPPGTVVVRTEGHTRRRFGWSHWWWTKTNIFVLGGHLWVFAGLYLWAAVHKLGDGVEAVLAAAVGAFYSGILVLMNADRRRDETMVSVPPATHVAPVHCPCCSGVHAPVPEGGPKQ